MTKYYAIVKFIDEDDALGIIPLNWVSENEDLCYFPNIKSDSVREKLIRIRADYEESWILCPIKILHKYETYSQARLNLKRAEETSNLDTDEELPNERKRKRKTPLLPGESEDDDNDIAKPNWKRNY
ncbi:hypothetical protein FQR65_LT17617 [Abscondita terminalis]|nr:hypothetical protein FQR65_LT17617 [Abscondita terminalis]